MLMLMEAEVNGAAAAKQASALRESIFNLCAPGSNVSITSGSALSMCPVRLGEHGNFRKKQEAFSVFRDAVFLSLSVSLLLKKPFGSESSALACQNELLLQKLETFEVTNRTLRKLLREQHESQVLCKMIFFLFTAQIIWRNLKRAYCALSSSVNGCRTVLMIHFMQAGSNE